MDQETFRQVLREVLLDELGVRDVELGDRWNDGELVLVPGKEGTQEKRIPLDVFFKKIVMVRDKLRVLEQKVNGNKNLSDEEKVQLQQYITGCYGSLTSFNVLFKHKEDHFTGQKNNPRKGVRPLFRWVNPFKKGSDPFFLWAVMAQVLEGMKTPSLRRWGEKAARTPSRMAGSWRVPSSPGFTDEFAAARTMS